MFRVGVFRSADGLTPAQHRGQALIEIVLRNGRAGMKHGEIRPSVEVIVDERTLTGRPIMDLADLASRVCEIVDGGPVAPATVRRFLCEGTAHRLVRSAEGEVLDCGHDIRLANRAQRRALRHRDGGCGFPGCTAPAAWCARITSSRSIRSTRPARRTWPTSSCCAGSTTTLSTKAATSSPSRRMVRSRCDDPTAPPSPPADPAARPPNPTRWSPSPDDEPTSSDEQQSSDEPRRSSAQARSPSCVWRPAGGRGLRWGPSSSGPDTGDSQGQGAPHHR